MEARKAMGESALVEAPKAPKGGKGKPAVEKVPYTKADGSTVMATPAQVAAWDKWKSREHLTLDEVKEVKFSGFTPEMDAWIKAHPICSRKEFKEQFKASGITKEQLRERRDALGVHKK
jgi:hypothetical protein